MSFIRKLREKTSQEVITDSDLKQLFRDMSQAAIHSGVSRALSSNELIRLKRGVYVFSEKLRQKSLSKFTIANHLSSPSYVSFESALSFHGLIPEAVYSTTSALTKRQKKVFQTPMGEFSYTYIPCKPFFIEVAQLYNGTHFLIANPLKALFDLAYVQRKNIKTLKHLEDDWRISIEDISEHVGKLTFKELEGLASLYKKQNIKILFELLVREFK